jgi:aspartate racemase
MQTIGLIGGMSWESTALYYELLNKGVKEKLGGLHSAQCVLYSVDFAEIERLQHEGKWDEAGEILAKCAVRLEHAGADLLLLCTNTMHIVADHIEQAATVPLLHLADATAGAILREGAKKVGLLGTAFTMEQPFYKDRLASHGVYVLVPDEQDRKIVHTVIYDELCLGEVKASSRDEYRRIIQALVEEGAEGIVSGCTEIELLVSQADCPVPLFRTTQLHVEAALERVLTSPGTHDQGIV